MKKYADYLLLTTGYFIFCFDNFVIKNKFSEFWHDNMFSVRTYHPVPITADVIKEIKNMGYEFRSIEQFEK